MSDKDNTPKNKPTEPSWAIPKWIAKKAIKDNLSFKAVAVYKWIYDHNNHAKYLDNNPNALFTKGSLDALYAAIRPRHRRVGTRHLHGAARQGLDRADKERTPLQRSPPVGLHLPSLQGRPPAGQGHTAGDYAARRGGRHRGREQPARHGRVRPVRHPLLRHPRRQPPPGAHLRSPSAYQDRRMVIPTPKGGTNPKTCQPTTSNTNPPNTTV